MLLDAHNIPLVLCELFFSANKDKVTSELRSVRQTPSTIQTSGFLPALLQSSADVDEKPSAICFCPLTPQQQLGDVSMHRAITSMTNTSPLCSNLLWATKWHWGITPKVASTNKTWSCVFLVPLYRHLGTSFGQTLCMLVWDWLIMTSDLCGKPVALVYINPSLLWLQPKIHPTATHPQICNYTHSYPENILAHTYPPPHRHAWNILTAIK